MGAWRRDREDLRSSMARVALSPDVPGSLDAGRYRPQTLRRSGETAGAAVQRLNEGTDERTCEQVAGARWLTDRCS